MFCQSLVHAVYFQNHEKEALFIIYIGAQDAPEKPSLAPEKIPVSFNLKCGWLWQGPLGLPGAQLKADCWNEGLKGYSIL